MQNPKVKEEVKQEIQKIKNSAPNTIFKIDGDEMLPPFGRPLCSQLKLGEMIYKELN